GSTEMLRWPELGLNLSGITEALVFSGKIEKERNPGMFEQYRKGYVKQHSVGMRYMKMVTCINDEDYEKQKSDWDKYIEQVVNKKEAEEAGYFWAVTEAKVIEGSAVLFGSNSITPSLEVKNSSQSSST